MKTLTGLFGLISLFAVGCGSSEGSEDMRPADDDTIDPGSGGQDGVGGSDVQGGTGGASLGPDSGGSASGGIGVDGTGGLMAGAGGPGDDGSGGSGSGGASVGSGGSVSGALPCDESELVAFPCAEGYGKIASGGRGGRVIEVTTLSGSGPGSLRDALSTSGPRTVVFRVGGTIEGNFSISNDDITVAGQTAPGDGIAIDGTLSVSASNVIVRYLRVRGRNDEDTITNNHGSKAEKVIFDHISASWSSDEVFSVYFDEDVTIQWSMITEAGSADHKFGAIWGNNRSTYHHNLFAHNTDRNPRIASGSGSNDVRNNVIYNWKNFSIYGCEVHQSGDSSHVGCTTNAVANYLKPGPGTPTSLNKHSMIVSPWSRGGESDYGDWYVADNFVDGHPDVTADNWQGVFPQYTGQIDDDRAALPGLKLNSPAEFMPIVQQTAQDAYLSVLEHVGTSMPRRDAVDERIIEEVRTGTATFGDNGFVSSRSAVGGPPQLAGGTAPTDADHDGMPDEWEMENGLDPNDAADGNLTYGPGFTMLEKYLNSLDSF